MPKILADSARCLSCHSCELACAVAHSSAGTLFGAVSESPGPKARVSVEKGAKGSLPLQCRHCDDPKCLYACVTKALKRDPAADTVVYDESLCIGCFMCVIACPFGSIERSSDKKLISKCDLCAGLNGSPACVAACMTNALSFEEVEDYSKNKRQAYVQGLDQEVDGGVL